MKNISGVTEIANITKRGKDRPNSQEWPQLGSGRRQNVAKTKMKKLYDGTSNANVNGV